MGKERMSRKELNRLRQRDRKIGTLEDKQGQYKRNG